MLVRNTCNVLDGRGVRVGCRVGAEVLGTDSAGLRSSGESGFVAAWDNKIAKMHRDGKANPAIKSQIDLCAPLADFVCTTRVFVF